MNQLVAVAEHPVHRLTMAVAAHMVCRLAMIVTVAVPCSVPGHLVRRLTATAAGTAL